MSTLRERREVYSRPRWRRLRKRVIYEQGYVCAGCREQGRIGPAEICHHRRPMKQGGDPWERSNLEAVCRKCHEERHRDVDDHIPREVRAWRDALKSILKPNEVVLT